MSTEPLEDQSVQMVTASETDPDTPEEVWVRDDTDGRDAAVDAGVMPFDDLHLHRYCDISPVQLADSPPGIETNTGWLAALRTLLARVELFPPADGTRPGTHEVIRYLPARGDELPEGESRSPLWFLRGTVRTVIQYTPFVVATLALIFVVAAELSPAVEGLSAYLLAVPSSVVPLAAVAVVLWGVLGYLLIGAGLVRGEELAKGMVVYGLVGVLSVGTAGSIYLVLTADDPTALPPNIIYTSGYLLVVLVGGLLTYDGMLRTEYMFNNLERTLVVEPEDQSAYEAFRRKLSRQLSDRTSITLVGEVRTCWIFAVLLVSQFAAIWAVGGAGPQNLSFSVTFVANVLIDVVMAIVYFQMFILIKGFHDLVTGQVTIADEDDIPEGPHALLSYRPFHPDGRGGFRDFGKFATRVNVLLILGGLYVGPVLVLLAVSLAWLYYSFWKLHVKMAREREQHYTSYLLRNRDENADDRLGSFDDALEWQERRAPAPVWPVDTRLLVSLVSSTVVPLVLALPRLML